MGIKKAPAFAGAFFAGRIPGWVWRIKPIRTFSWHKPCQRSVKEFMQCPKCGGEAEANGFCKKCVGGEPEIKVLNPEERDNFNGLTIQQGNEREPGPDYPQWPSDSNHEYRSEGPGHRVYVRQVSFGSQSTSLLTKLLIAAVMIFLLFVALPIALIIVVASSLLWWLFRR